MTVMMKLQGDSFDESWSIVQQDGKEVFTKKNSDGLQKAAGRGADKTAPHFQS